MQLPGVAGRIINDLVPDVIDALQQRTDIATMAPRYIAKALKEITESYPFEELRTNGAIVQLTPIQSLYPISFFLRPGDDYTSNEVFNVYVDFPNNTVVTAINYKTPKGIAPMTTTATRGTPGWWTRFGSNFFFGPTPDKAYSVQLFYQFRHPFPDDQTQLGFAKMYIPDSWEDIIAYAAAERIAIVKRWNDQADYLHKILFGDPASTNSQGVMNQPGLIAARTSQAQRDGRFNTRQIGIIVPRYSSR